MNIDKFYFNLKNTTEFYNIIEVRDVRWALIMANNVNILISYGLIETLYFKSVHFGIKF